MIQIFENMPSGTYDGIVDLELSIEGSDSNTLQEYGIAQSVIPNVYNFTNYNMNSVKITINQSRTITYYLYKINNPTTPIGGYKTLFFVITPIHNDIIELDTTTHDNVDPLKKDYFFVTYGVPLNSSISQYFTVLTYQIDPANYNMQIDRHTFNKGDYDTVNQRSYSDGADSYDKLLSATYDDDFLNPIRHILRAGLYGDKDEVQYRGSLIIAPKLFNVDYLPLPCRCPAFYDTLYDSSDNSYIPMANTIKLSLLSADANKCQSEIEKLNNTYKIKLTDIYGYESNYSLDAYVNQNVEQCYYISFLDQFKIQITLENETIYKSDDSICGQTKKIDYDTNVESPVINNEIINNEITVIVSSLAESIIYKLHLDTTSYDNVSDQTTVNLNRVTYDIDNFDNIETKTIKIPCSSSVASIEAYCHMGIYSEKETKQFLRKRIIPWLSDQDNLHTSDFYTCSLWSPNYPHSYNMTIGEQNDKALLIFGPSKISKQLLSNVGNIKENDYKIILDNYNKSLEITSYDTTTYDINIESYLNNNRSDNFAKILIDHYNLQVGGNSHDLPLHAAQLYSRYADVPMTESESINKINAVDTRIIKNNKFLMCSALMGREMETLAPLYPMIINLEYMASVPYTTYEVNRLDHIYGSTNYGFVPDKTKKFDIFNEFNIVPTHIDIEYKAFVVITLGNTSSDHKFVTIDVDDSSDKTIILDNLYLYSLKIEGNDGNEYEHNGLGSSNTLLDQPILSADFTSCSAGFRKITMMALKKERYSALSFSDPIIIENLNKSDFYKIEVYLCPYISLSGGNITNGSVGYNSRLTYNMDYVISDTTAFIDLPIVDDTISIVDGTATASSYNVTTIDTTSGNHVSIVDLSNKSVEQTTNNWKLLLAGIHFDEYENPVLDQIKLSEYVHHDCGIVSVGNIEQIYDFKNTVSTDLTNSTQDYDTGIGTITFGNGYDYSYTIGYRDDISLNASYYPIYSKNVVSIPMSQCHYMSKQGNFQNAATERIEFDIFVKLLPNEKYNNLPIIKNGNISETLKYNRSMPKLDNIITVPISIQFDDTSVPLQPAIVPILYSGPMVTNHQRIYIRAFGEGGLLNDVLPENVYTFPQQQDEQEVAISVSRNSNSILTFTDKGTLRPNDPTTYITTFPTGYLRMTQKHLDNLQPSFTKSYRMTNNDQCTVEM